MKTIKKTAICLLMMLPFIGFCQKKENGKIYIEHPALNVVDAFTKAMVSGDTTAMSKLMTNDFKAYYPVVATPFDEPTNKSGFLRNALNRFMQFNYYSIKTMDGAYPDAFEYVKDQSDNNAVTVDTWDVMKGVHKKTGVKMNMYLHRSFTLTKDNKIRMITSYTNPEVGNEINRSASERKNGTIYNQHENINKLRLMMAAAEHSDWNTYYSYFNEEATFYDINSMDSKPTSLDVEKANDKAILDKFEFAGIEQTGYPDYMHYEIGDSGVLYSWWNLHLIRKSDKKAIKVPIHYEHDVDKDGKINNVISYYNAALLK